MATLYRRATHNSDGSFRDGVAWIYVNKATGGIVHLLRPDRWLSIGEVQVESMKYNACFDEPAFPTDPFIVTSFLRQLVAAGMAEERSSERVQGDNRV